MKLSSCLRTGLVLLLMVTVLTGCGGKKKSSKKKKKKPSATAKADSTGRTSSGGTAKGPNTKAHQELFSNLTSAMQEQRWEDAFACYSRESKPLLIGTMIVGAKRIADSDPAKKTSFDMLTSSLGLTAEDLTFSKPPLEMKYEDLVPVAKELGGKLEINDLPKHFKEVMTWLSVNIPLDPPYRFFNPEEWKNSTLYDIIVDRNEATGFVAVTIPADEANEIEASEIKHKLVFTQEIGKWYIDLEKTDPLKKPASTGKSEATPGT